MALNQAVVEKLGVAEADLTKQLVSDVCDIFSTMVGVIDERGRFRGAIALALP